LDGRTCGSYATTVPVLADNGGQLLVGRCDPSPPHCEQLP